MKEIFNRRSIRKYQDRPVEKEKIEKLLRAAMQAPSAANQQPWEFIVVENKEALKKLSLASPYATPVAGSSVTLVLLANSDKFRVATAWEEDMGAAAENILLEAVYLELGAVWLGVATSDQVVKNIKDNFNLPDNIKPFALISVGYADTQKNAFVDRFDASRVHYEEWK